MTRLEFISKLALLDDLEFDGLVLIYKEGGKPKKEEETLTESLDFPTYESFAEYLKDTGRFSNDYDYEAFYNDPMALNPKETNGINGLTPLRFWMLQEQEHPGKAHMPGKYKKPNHMTYGGKNEENWKNINGIWHYIVPEDHYNYSFEDYRNYWDNNELESILHYKDKQYKVQKHLTGGFINNNFIDKTTEEYGMLNPMEFPPRGENWGLITGEKTGNVFWKNEETGELRVAPSKKDGPSNTEPSEYDKTMKNMNSTLAIQDSLKAQNPDVGNFNMPQILVPELFKPVTLKKGGSILDQLKELLGDSEIIDLLQHFGIDELMEGGLKNTGNMSISIMIESGEEPLRESKKESKKDLTRIEIGNLKYDVEIVTSEEDMEKGLGGRESLDSNKGMLFDFKETLPEVVFNMEEMKFPLDLVFINEDDEVIRVAENCLPGGDLFRESDVRYVLEVNANSGINKGDELDLDSEDDGPVMKVLTPNGETLMELKGGERIFSRKITKRLIKWAKKCEKTQNESDFKRLGQLMLDEIDALDTRKPEYVSVPED